jgi:hypothetical protein
MTSLFNNIGLIVRELYSIMSKYLIFFHYTIINYIVKSLIILSIDYKQKISLIQFVIDLIWEIHVEYVENRMETDQIDKTESNLVMKSISDLFKIVQELNLFNPIDDQTNSNMFINWAKDFLKKTFSCTFK